jgi:hypothetical protein
MGHKTGRKWIPPTGQATPCTAKWSIFWALLWLLPGGLWAAEQPRVPIHAACAAAQEGLPSDEALEADGAVIGEVTIQIGDIFDPGVPGENHWAYRTVNRLHRKTRDGVLEHQLLFHPGERYSRDRLQETERLLRRDGYLFDAEICPIRYADHRVDVMVITRDVWTLKAGVSFGRSGGENHTSYQVEDSNFLGTGRELTFKYTTDVDRSTSLLRFTDEHLFGSWTQLGVRYAESSDGFLRGVKVERPFYALNARWAAGLEAATEERTDSLYTLGDVRDRFGHDTDFVEGHWGFSSGLHERTTRRWKVGATFERHHFFDAGDAEFPSALPPDRTMAYPWVQFELLEDRFVEGYAFSQLGRTEDLALGTALRARLGYSSSALGADREGAIFALGASQGWQAGDKLLVFGRAHSDGRWNDGGLENFSLGTEAELFWRDLGPHLFYARLGLDVTRDLDPDRQLLLGGDNGLRGYPLRYQEGDRRFLLTLEQRFFTPWHLFHLVRVGGAVFFDIGRSWFSGGDPIDQGKLLRDVGFGLRLAPSRSGRGNVIHVDIAFPLDGQDTISGTQILVRTRNSF